MLVEGSGKEGRLVGGSGRERKGCRGEFKVLVLGKGEGGEGRGGKYRVLAGGGEGGEGE